MNGIPTLYLESSVSFRYDTTKIDKNYISNVSVQEAAHFNNENVAQVKTVLLLGNIVTCLVFFMARDCG